MRRVDVRNTFPTALGPGDRALLIEPERDKKEGEREGDGRKKRHEAVK